MRLLLHRQVLPSWHSCKYETERITMLLGEKQRRAMDFGRRLNILSQFDIENRLAQYVPRSQETLQPPLQLCPTAEMVVETPALLLLLEVVELLPGLVVATSYKDR
jgi:hypothetical protein